ncbi:MAG: VOC family protein [Candidatus Saccharibacteria bacterium]|nr:VOC family protein [Candidatus Saccharibacteria bacterium]
MGNNIVHFEIYVDDLERAQKFYTEVLGWAFDYRKDYDYTLVYPGGKVTEGPATVGVNGGMMKRNAPAPSDDKASPNAFVCTISVDDVDATLEKVTANGGRIDVPAMEVPGVGRLAYVRDSEMNLIGLLKPDMSSMGM